MTTTEHKEFTELKYIRAERYWTPNEALRYDVLLAKLGKSFKNKMNKVVNIEKQIEQN